MVCFSVFHQRAHQQFGHAAMTEVGRDLGMAYVPAAVVFGIADVACFQTVNIDLKATAFGVVDNFGYDGFLV